MIESQKNGKRRRQEDRRVETRRRLVDATIMLLHEKGAGQLTMADVAREAGLTRGAIQYHFENPKSLLIASIEEIASRLSQHLDATELASLPLTERIDRIVDDYWQGFRGFNYTAFIEIAVRGRQDPDFEEAIATTLEELERRRADVWQAIFEDTGRNRAEIRSWRHMLLVTLRGLALTNMIPGGNEKVSLQIDQFKAMFKRYLTDA
ncbi:TetR/AcrR family transcriptional regulator [Sneathiella sp. CAU 1612]|uniref:TetR/AcrR family transcriptional regulator n=1 Tax=Sneathiella sedimenti TaxID=2816034 RepID=A0ABS3F0H4_9PROT|nr:TetR/AcrR family transcriptional regulator [Sneathiella sedimenti]MBO0332013.1 TetR/AcrR family transcriptional regulator [Sneathiella sedimenti]